MASPKYQIELPHLRDGEIDWKTLGNILAAHILGEVLHASYVDYKYGVKTSEYRADTSWEFFYEENDVIVLRKQFLNSPIHAWIGRCVINLPMEDVIAFLQDHGNRKYFDKYLAEIREERRISDIDFIMYLHLQATQCLVKQHRDFIYYERMGYVEGKFVRSALSVNLPEYTSVRGITRAEMLPGTGWVLEPYGNNKTLVSFCAHIDLKNLPPLIINRAARRSPMCVYHFREFLTNPDYRRKHGKAASPVRSDEDFSASEISFMNRQDLQSSHTQQRFQAEQQLSVRDYLKNRPSLRKNYSVPANLHSSKRVQDTEFKDRWRSHSHDESVESDVRDEDSEKLRASHLPSLRYPTSNPSANGFHVQETMRDTREKDENRAMQGKVLMENYQHPLHSESDMRGKTPPFLTPETTEDEGSPISHYYSPVNSQNSLSSGDESTHTVNVTSGLATLEQAWSHRH